MYHRRVLLVIVGLMALLQGSSAAAKQTAERCAAAKDVAASQLAAARLACLRAALLHNQPVAASCVAQAAAKFLGKTERIEAKGSCRPGADATRLIGFADNFAASLEGALAEAPTVGALRVSWILRSTGSPVACSAVAGQAGMDVTLTPMGGGNAISQALPCEPGQGDVINIPFGTYTVVVSILNDQQQALGQSATQQVTFDATCDLIVSGDCAKTLAVDVSIL